MDGLRNTLRFRLSQRILVMKWQAFAVLCWVVERLYEIPFVERIVEWRIRASEEAIKRERYR